jgi:MarR family transcriptional regulator, transcriptional regulator for hemolysin
MKSTENEEEPLGRILSHLGRLYLAELNKKLSHIDLKRSYYALIQIEKSGGKLTQNELAARLKTDKVLVVRIIDYLSANGYVERIKNPSDRRKYSLMLTEKAKQQLPNIKLAIKEVTELAIEGLSQDETVLLYHALEKIKFNLNNTKFLNNYKSSL